MSIFLENSDTDSLMILANNFRKEYNKKRELWYRDATRYFHQAIASDYCKEECLISSIEECAKLKLQYKEVCDILKSRGCHASIGDSWTIEDPIKPMMAV